MVLRKEITLQIKDLLKENPQGLSITDIVKVVPINRNTAGRYLENLLISGQVEMRRLGMAKIYILSQRVPLSAVLSISSELVIQLDNSLRIIFANEPFLKLVGTESKSLLGKNIEYTPVALVFDEAFTGFIENIKEGINGKDSAWDIVLTKKDLIFFCRIAPTVFDDGRKGVSVLLEDITEKKRTEKTLQESEERYRQLVDISPDAVILHQDRKIIFMNPAALNLLGASHSDEFIGKNILDFIHPDFRDVVRKNIEKDLIGSTSPPIELHMLRVDGTPVIVEGRGVKTSIDGKPAIQVAIRDITERKRVEEILQKSEKQYRSLVETTGTGYVILDKAGRVITANQEYVRLTGRSTLAEIEKRSVTDWTAPYDLERNAREIEQCFRIGQVRGLEVDYQRPDGTIQSIEINASVIQSDSEQIVLTLCRDITERKRATEALQKTEEKYRTLIDRANDGIVVVQDSIIKMCNRYVTEFWGASIEEILGRPFTDFIHPEALSEVLDRYNQRMAGENPPPIYQTTLKRKDGSQFFAELNAGIISYGGSPADLIIIRDINERKKIEAALRESEEKYRTLINQANDVISIVQDGVIKMCNPRLAEFWGGSIEEVLGKPFTDFVHPEALHEVIDRYNRRMAGESPPSLYETVCMRKDGSKSYVELNAGIISYKGKNADLVIVRDINERKKAEETLRESEATARELLNAPTDSVILIDCEGKILALNEIAASRFGKRSDELVGIMSYDILPKEVAQLRRSLMAPVLEKREMVRFVDQRDGRWYDTVAYPIVNESGNVKKIAIIARDVTEQKNIEKQLQKSEQIYKRLLEQSFDAIAIHKQGKITFLNERAAKVLGAAKPEDLIGRPIFDFIHPESRKDLEDRLKELSATEGMSAPLITEKFIRTDGSTVTVEVMAISFDDNGIPASRVAFREISTP